MTVIILSAVPVGLRGVLTRWFIELAPGVFIGHVSARVREQVWMRVQESMGRGRALLVHSTRGEQRLAFRSLGHEWTPTDFDGIELMMRPDRSDDGRAPYDPATPGNRSGPPPHWSNAGHRRFRR